MEKLQDNKDQITDDAGKSGGKKSKVPKERKLSYRQKRRQLKKEHRLLYRVRHQEKKPHPVLYGIELFFGVLFETLRYLRNFVVCLLLIGIVVGIAGSVFVFNKFLPTYKEYAAFADDLVHGLTRSDFNISESSTIYNSSGDVIAVLRETGNTKYLVYDEIPQDVINAFVAVEDRSFWDNDGVDYKGIVRVILRAVRSNGEELHGASTITQQLVRNNFLTREVSMERKLKEMLISWRLTKEFSKRDIMEFYVNDICYANGIYGIGGAARSYFDLDVDELSLSQIAYLCAIPNSPSYYDPYKNPENALERRDKILDDMYECGYIEEGDLLLAKQEVINITRPAQVFSDYETTYAVDCVIRYLMELDGFEFRYGFEGDQEGYEKYQEAYAEEYADMRHKLYTGGYKIYTSLDSKVYAELQGVLDEALSFDTEVNEETGIYALQGALTCIDNSNGKVVAVVGGRSQDDLKEVYSFNRAYQSYRQPGSSIKPVIVYAPALEHGYRPESTLYDINVTKAKEKDAKVQEMTGSSISLRSAVEVSKNGCAWQVFDALSPSVGIKYIERMHYAGLCPDDYYNAASLGGFTKGVTTVEQASAYYTLANHGEFIPPTCIVSILDSDDEEIWIEPEPEEIYTYSAADNMVDICRGVLTRGTASRLGWGKTSKMDAFAKTGTTNGSKDGWFCGATPYYSIAVWVGYDQPRTVSGMQGGTYPGQIWKSSMLYMIGNKDLRNFERKTSVSGDGEFIETEGYYSYLPGRDDSEVLSSGYTVQNYREDRVKGETIQAYISKINALDMSDSSSAGLLEQYYSEATAFIASEIYSRKYSTELTQSLNAAYSAKKN